MSVCCVNGCSNNFYNNKTVMFYRFPMYKRQNTDTVKDLVIRQRMGWINALKDNSTMTLENIHMKRVCSAHFKSGKKADFDHPHHPDWIPTLNVQNDKDDTAAMETDFDVNIESVVPIVDIMDSIHIDDIDLDNNHKDLLALMENLYSCMKRRHIVLGRINLITICLEKKIHIGKDWYPIFNPENLVKKLLLNQAVPEFSIDLELLARRKENLQKMLNEEEKEVDRVRKLLYEMVDKRSYDFVIESLHNMEKYFETIVNETNTRMYDNAISSQNCNKMLDYSWRSCIRHLAGATPMEYRDISKDQSNKRQLDQHDDDDDGTTDSKRIKSISNDITIGIAKHIKFLFSNDEQPTRPFVNEQPPIRPLVKTEKSKSMPPLVKLLPHEVKPTQASKPMHLLKIKCQQSRPLINKKQPSRPLINKTQTMRIIMNKKPPIRPLVKTEESKSTPPPLVKLLPNEKQPTQTSKLMSILMSKKKPTRPLLNEEQTTRPTMNENRPTAPPKRIPPLVSLKLHPLLKNDVRFDGKDKRDGEGEENREKDGLKQNHSSVDLL